MTSRERLRLVTLRLTDRLLLQFADDVRHARLELGLTQKQVAKLAGTSQATVSRVESGKIRQLSFIVAAQIDAAVGSDLWVKTYPSGHRPRDLAQLLRLDTFHANGVAPLRHRREVPLPVIGPHPDQRAWDATIEDGHEVMAVEFEVRLYDYQAQLRRIRLKQRDGQPDRLLVVVADTSRNRRVLREFGPLDQDLPQLSRKEVVADLRAGRLPRSGIVLV